MTTLWEAVAAHVHERPGAVAVIDDGGARHTYAELAADVDAFARQLAPFAVGDVATVQLPNRYESVVAAVAVLRHGMVLNPVLPNYRANELRHIFATARSKLVLTPAVYRGFDHRQLVAELADVLSPDAVHVVVDDGAVDRWRAAAADAAAPPPTTPDPSRVSELIFSSGTEATPKGVLHTEATTNAGALAVFSSLSMTSDDVVWMPSPIGHSTGFNFGLRFALVHGLPLVLQDRWDPAVAAGLVGDHGCTYTLAATTFLQDLVAELHRRGERRETMGRFMCGGAPVPAELVDAAAEVGITVLRLYGSTEALVATFNRPGTPLDLRRATDGRACDGAEVRTVDDEIQVRSPQCAIGYFEDPERTAATFLDDGWVRSGDVGVIDDDGHLRVVGRKKEIIIRGGLNISPREIEDLIVAFAEVERCAVVGVPDDRMGERTCACVTLQPGSSLDLATVVARLEAAGLARYKLPERLVVVDALPMTASGKVQKHVLKGML